MKSAFLRFASSVILVSILSLALGGCSGSRIGGRFDWPQWRGPDGNGISRETGWNPKALADGPRILWEVNVGTGYSSVVIKGDRLYTMGLTGVYCLGADNGKIIWKAEYPDFRPPQSTPTVDGTSVYTLSLEGRLSCRDALNGKLRWERNIAEEFGAVMPYYGFAGSPVVEGDLVLLTANTAGMALKKSTGDLVWTSEQPPETARIEKTTGTEYSTPVIYQNNGKSQALLYSWKGLTAVEVTTGKELWSYAWNLGNVQVADPVPVGNRVLLMEEWEPGPENRRYSVFLEVKGGTPAVLWKSAELFSDIATPVVVDGFVYSCHGGPHSESPFASLCCLELDTGKLKWEVSLGSNRPTKHNISLMASDGKLIILNDEGTLFIAEASPEGYEEIARCDVLAGGKGPRNFFSAPVLCNGRIYCRNMGGELICIGAR